MTTAFLASQFQLLEATGPTPVLGDLAVAGSADRIGSLILVR